VLVTYPARRELYPQFEYMVDLYENYGAIDTPNYPTFFASIIHSA
jgi:hypothetical protein